MGWVPRTLPYDLEAALWHNVRRASRYLSRRLRGVGLEIEWVGVDERLAVRQGASTARMSGTPGEVLLYLVRAAGQCPSGGQRARRSGSRRFIAPTSVCESLGPTFAPRGFSASAPASSFAPH